MLASTKSAASRWMEEERRLEDKMERSAAAARDSTTTASDGDRPPPSPSSSTSSSSPGGGRWEEMHGNYILRPHHHHPSSSSSSPSLSLSSAAQQPQPRALIHFLGGAFLGAAPQLTYRYMLERLSSRGYLMVATPYQLSFDHLATCDEVIGMFEMVAPDLVRRELFVSGSGGRTREVS
jgi:hypothetical protein